MKIASFFLAAVVMSSIAWQDTQAAKKRDVTESKSKTLQFYHPLYR